MESNYPFIYGLEFQARTLTSQQHESDVIRFIVGTQSLKFTQNQIHIIEVNEDNTNAVTTVCPHSAGELWHISASPHDANFISSVYNTTEVEMATVVLVVVQISRSSDGMCALSFVGGKMPCTVRIIKDRQRPRLRVFFHFSKVSLMLFNVTVEDKHPITEHENVCFMKSAIWKINDDSLELRTQLPVKEIGHDVKQTWFHPTESGKALSIIDNHYVIWDIKEAEAKNEMSGTLEGKGQPRFTCGKWNPHHNVSQVTTGNEGNVRGWDIRSGIQSWIIESAHSQLVRDFDFNPNRQYYLATCGDDGFTRFWDIRNTTVPVVSRSDHSHWVWAVRYNHFHDQLILTSSSDSRVILSCVSGISSEPSGHIISDEESDAAHDKLEDGVICRYDEHEDSVYAVEWSHSDPWTFASLSYDGRLVINTIPREYKYKILL